MENNHLRTEPRALPPKETALLEIEKLIYGGAGLARKDGQVFFVPKVIAGEKVEAELGKAKSNFTRAKLSRVIEASPQRIPAPCQYFDRCGGCHYQQMSYADQLEAKRNILRELFERAKLDLPVEIKTVSGPEWNYRNRSQFHFHNNRVGYLEEGTNKLVAVENCPVSSPRINEALGLLKKLARDHRFPDFLKSIEFFSNERDLQVNVLETNRPLAKHFFAWLEKEIPGVQSGAIEYPAAGYDWKVSYTSFFQINRFLVDDLTRLATENLSGQHVVDLFAGVGLFSLPIAKSFERVTAVESGKVAMYDLQENAKRYNVRNIRIVQASVDAWLNDLDEVPDVILADPPRSGLGVVAAQRLAEIASPEIRLISCDPATLARDLAILAPAGYRMVDMTLIDLFPHTFHIETVTRLRRD